MAQVDFTNARIAPRTDSSVAANVTVLEDVSLSQSYNGVLFNSSGTQITSSNQRTLLKNTKKQLVFLYSGTFSASGTEIYIIDPRTYGTGWKITNISFSSGDTYVFSIKADLICQ